MPQPVGAHITNPGVPLTGGVLRKENTMAVNGVLRPGHFQMRVLNLDESVKLGV